MRAVLRLIFGGGGLLCAILLLALGALCVRSYFVDDVVAMELPHADLQIESCPGELWVLVTRLAPQADPVAFEYNHIINPPNEDNEIILGGLIPQEGTRSWRVGRYGLLINESSHERWLGLPLILLCALLSWSPFFLAAELRAWRGRRRSRSGRCSRCGYDLRASSQRCPECGTAISAKPAAFSRGERMRWVVIGASLATCVGLFILVTPSGKAPNLPYAKIPGVYADWQAATGTDLNRMAYFHGWGFPEFRTIWRHDGQEFLVFVEDQDAVMFAEGWTVYVLDRKQRLVRQGSLLSWGVPYCIMEVKTSSERFPASLRGKWTLAVGFSPSGQKFDAKLPVVFNAGAIAPPDRQVHVSSNAVELQPVDWDDLSEPFHQGVGILDYLKDLQIRAAEPNMPATAPSPQAGQ